MSTQGNRFKRIRNELQMSQEDFANFFQTSVAYISQIEKDKCGLSVNNLIKLSLKYNVNLNYLLCDRGTPFLNQYSENIKNEILAELVQLLKTQKILHD